MRRPDRPILQASPEEERLIAELTAEPAFDRLDRGEAEIVDFDDWSDVPESPQTEALVVPVTLYRRLQAASRKKRTTPERLAAKLIEQGLSSK